MSVRLASAVVVLAACAGGAPPELNGLSDQIAAVGHEVSFEIDATDADGDILTYDFTTDIDIADRSSLTRTPAGAGVFRWTPNASDVGMHSFDFSASDGQHDATETIVIDVRASLGGAPVFRNPLGTGEVVDLDAGGCTDLNIVVDDEDTVDVDITQGDPVIDGAELTQIDGRTATWHWCPSSQQIAQGRFTLILSADDHDNPPTIKEYVLVLRNGTASEHLVINEVDYDQVGTDSAEYVEIYNPSGSAISLAGIELVLVNGSNSAVYDTVDLSGAGTLASKSFVVVAGAGVTVGGGAKKVDPGWVSDRIQNGPPDGLALVDINQHAVLDTLSYEGSITQVTITNVSGTVSLVEGTALPVTTADSNTVTGSLCRATDGQDLDDAAVDWTFCQATPGTANKQ
jgi:lamin tail-like protein/Big-like domain-containing protein